MRFFNFSAQPQLRQSPLLRQQPAAPTGNVQLQDMTSHARVGVRGRQAAALLQTLDCTLPKAVNQAVASASGLWVLRLGHHEYWLIDSSGEHQARITEVEAAAHHQQDVYPLYCQHSHGCLQLTGAHLSELMAKLCAVDCAFSAFPTGAIAQTVVARVNSIIVRLSHGDSESLLLLADISTLGYLWEVLVDAASHP